MSPAQATRWKEWTTTGDLQADVDAKHRAMSPFMPSHLPVSGRGSRQGRDGGLSLSREHGESIPLDQGTGGEEA